MPSDSGNVVRSDGASWVPIAYGPAASVDALHPQNHGPANHTGFVSSWDYPVTMDLAVINSSTVWSLANRACFWRSLGTGTGTNAFVRVLTSSGNVCVAGYSNSGVGRGSTPGTRVFTTGSVACPAVTASPAGISLGGSFTLNAGDWICVGADNIVCAFRCTATALQNVEAIANGRAYNMDAAAFPAPGDNPTMAGGCTSQVVGVAIA